MKNNRICGAGLAALLMLPVTAALAATVQESLQGMNPAGANCPKGEQVPAVLQKASQPTAVAPDMSCVIGVDALLPLMKDGNAVIVDTRSRSDYEAFRIDGALNLSPGEIKTKPFLKSHTLVLTGTGKGDRELYEACRTLKAQGYANATVLRGGMLAWLNRQQPVVGQAPDPAGLATLSAEELSRELLFENNLVLTTLPLAKLKDDLKKSVIVGNGSPQAIKRALDARRKQGKHAVASVIVVLGERAERAKIIAAQQFLYPDPVLFYAEPVQAYADYLASRRAMWSAQERGPKTPKCAL